MRGDGRARTLLVAVTAALTALTAASAAQASHQPGDYVVDAFEVDIDASGVLSGTVSDFSGGTWTIQASPHWRVLYPQVLVPTLADNETVPSPEPDYNHPPYAGTAGPVTWAGTTELNGMAPVDPFSCTGELSGPQQIGTNPQLKPQVQVSGDQAHFELPTLNGIRLLGNGSCSPAQASGFTSWGIDAQNRMQAFFTVPREQLVEDESFRLATGAGPRNSLGACTANGSCAAGLDWSAEVTLKKVCRGFAGTATTVNAGGFGSTAPFCESECSEAACAAEDFELQPPNKALKEKGGAVQIPAACYGDSPCQGQMTLGGAKGFGRAKGGGSQSFGETRFRVKPDNHAKVKVELSAAAMKMLKQTGFLPVTVKSKLKGDEDEVADRSDKETQTIQG